MGTGTLKNVIPTAKNHSNYFILSFDSDTFKIPYFMKSLQKLFLSFNNHLNF